MTEPGLGSEPGVERGASPVIGLTKAKSRTSKREKGAPLKGAPLVPTPSQGFPRDAFQPTIIYSAYSKGPRGQGVIILTKKLHMEFQDPGLEILTEIS